MRELNECRAEIFRRSDERIKKRKRIRNRMLSCCILLCFCMVGYLAMNLPAGENMATNGAEKGMADNESADMMNGDTTGSTAYAYIEVEIQDADDVTEYDQKITDKAEVINIFSVIQNLYNGTEEDFGTSEGNKETVDVYQTTQSSNKSEYVITFTMEDGTQTVYTLKGNELANMGTDEKRCLTNDQLAELEAVIGVAK